MASPNNNDLTGGGNNCFGPQHLGSSQPTNPSSASTQTSSSAPVANMPASQSDPAATNAAFDPSSALQAHPSSTMPGPSFVSDPTAGSRPASAASNASDASDSSHDPVWSDDFDDLSYQDQARQYAQAKANLAKAIGNPDGDDDDDPDDKPPAPKSTRANKQKEPEDYDYTLAYRPLTESFPADTELVLLGHIKHIVENVNVVITPNEDHIARILDERVPLLSARRVHIGYIAEVLMKTENPLYLTIIKMPEDAHLGLHVGMEVYYPKDEAQFMNVDAMKLEKFHDRDPDDDNDKDLDGDFSDDSEQYAVMQEAMVRELEADTMAPGHDPGHAQASAQAPAPRRPSTSHSNNQSSAHRSSGALHPAARRGHSSHHPHVRTYRSFHGNRRRADNFRQRGFHGQYTDRDRPTSSHANNHFAGPAQQYPPMHPQALPAYPPPPFAPPPPPYSAYPMGSIIPGQQTFAPAGYGSFGHDATSSLAALRQQFGHMPAQQWPQLGYGQAGSQGWPGQAGQQQPQQPQQPPYGGQQQQQQRQPPWGRR